MDAKNKVQPFVTMEHARYWEIAHAKKDISEIIVIQANPLKSCVVA